MGRWEIWGGFLRMELILFSKVEKYILCNYRSMGVWGIFREWLDWLEWEVVVDKV